MNWRFGDDRRADKKYGLFKNNACRRHPRYRPSGDCGISRRESRGYSTLTCSVKPHPSISQTVGLRNDRCWALFGHHAMSDLGPLCALERTWKPIRIGHRGLRVSPSEKVPAPVLEVMKQGSCTHLRPPAQAHALDEFRAQLARRPERAPSSFHARVARQDFVSSTRRFFARPSSLPLSAAGLSGP